MLDFLVIRTKDTKTGTEIYPQFRVTRSEDIMVKGSAFYAIWVESKGLWSTNEFEAIDLIDSELEAFGKRYSELQPEKTISILFLRDCDSGSIDKWHKFCKQQMPDTYHQLDERLIFANDTVTKKTYASKKLPYPLLKAPTPAYDRIMSVLYSDEERHKIEWAIGAIVSGDSVKIQKFIIFYGDRGTGKSTIMNIMEQLFDGYCEPFDASALGSATNAFALEAFRNNPLVAIQHDGDLSRIETNARLNSLVSHEMMTVNEKFKSPYPSRFNTFLIMGTNHPVRITDSRSGLLRRLIDISPTGHLIPKKEYDQLYSQIPFELGGIAEHCLTVYSNNPGYFDDYVPVNMLGASNDFYNFIMDNYLIFKEQDGTTLKAAWEMYKSYVEYARIPYPLSQIKFKEELRNYFYEFLDRYTLEDGTRVRSYYKGLKEEQHNNSEDKQEIDISELIEKFGLKEQPSLFDKVFKDTPAQYEEYMVTWDKCKTKLKDIDTHKIHFVNIPEDMRIIVIDFDLKDISGNKSLYENLKAASEYPATYTEVSKSGNGIHLHYIYDGDPMELSRLIKENIEIKVFNGGSTLRRCLTLCNDIPIRHISSGLPRKEKKMTDFTQIADEKHLRGLILKNLKKEIIPYTKPSIDLIVKDTNEAYNSGMAFDILDLKPAITSFAASSTNNSYYCIKQIDKMKFKGREEPKNDISHEGPENDFVIFDVECYPNLFHISYKFLGKDRAIRHLTNPTPAEIESLLGYKLIGYNNRRYDNHLIYACYMGYTVPQIYNLSQSIIKDGKGFFGEAYNISYTDIYDYLSKKQSLKKWEIELGIEHKEMGIPWDQPVPDSMVEEVIKYCDNDVLATEAVFEHCKADFTARKILADVAGGTPNDTTNSLTAKIIFGKERNPQSAFNYRFMGCNVTDNVYEKFDSKGRPLYPGYKFERGVSTYRGEEVGEGGYVYAEPGIYENVALLDIASMHPSSIVAENLFGDEYTKRFKDIMDIRIAVKHKKFDEAKKMFGGKLERYLNDPSMAKDLAQALKIAINSVYGLTSAKFDNPFRDIRNIDNIVAKRGALFMINLKRAVQEKGYTVAHIKTDSIKIPNADKDIIDFVMDYGKKYGYNFEHEATYERMCLVNDAVYIAKYPDGHWTATGAQFQVPYVFKTLFSKEDICFKDLCETKSVSSAIYLDFNEDLPDVSEYEKQMKKILKDDPNVDVSDLKGQIAKGHHYTFVGRVGSFVPVKKGLGGGVLLRDAGDGKYANVTGSSGYRWIESSSGLTEQDVDMSYFHKLVDDAVEAIGKYGDVEWFTS